MALSLSNFLYICYFVALHGPLALAGTVVHDFNITWVTRNPDGLAERPVMGINGQWPIPQITVTKGDRLIVNVLNQLRNQSTSLHFHGLYQNGSNEMDGPVGVTQCAIAPGSSFTYNFTVDQPGTYWYHSHVRAQYPDGLRGAFIVHDPDSPYTGMYDEEVVLTMSDWYHDQMPALLTQFINPTNPTGAEPVPDSALFNDSQNITLSVNPGKTYLFRLINMGAFAGQYFWFEGHTMRIVEVDGIWTEPAEADMIYITAAQRYGVLVTARDDTNANFAFIGSMDESLFDKVPPTLNPNATGWLVYNEQLGNPQPTLKDSFSPFDDFYLVPSDHEKIFEPVDRTVTLELKMDDLGDGANYAFFNDVTYVAPKVPSLYSVLSTGPNATDPVIYGSNTNSFVLEYGQVVEIVLNNNDAGKHPFHLHGHAFQAVQRSDPDAGFYGGSTQFAQTPMRRDTFMVRPNGNFVIRFQATNPGVWLFHCHIEWHIATGLVATMIEAPLEMQKTLSIPKGHLEACKASNTPTRGNAAGNTEDLSDLTGEPLPPPPLPAGFTSRGIAALVFSCISAFLGMAVISWYGAAPIGKQEFAAARKRIQQAGLQT